MADKCIIAKLSAELDQKAVLVRNSCQKVLSLKTVSKLLSVTLVSPPPFLSALYGAGLVRWWHHACHLSLLAIAALTSPPLAFCWHWTSGLGFWEEYDLRFEVWLHSLRPNQWGKWALCNFTEDRPVIVNILAIYLFLFFKVWQTDYICIGYNVICVWFIVDTASFETGMFEFLVWIY